MSEKIYEIGSEVKVSGKWYELLADNGDEVEILHKTDSGQYSEWIDRVHVEDCRVPSPIIHEWLSWINWSDNRQRNHINKILTNKYGAPPSSSSINPKSLLPR